MDNKYWKRIFRCTPGSSRHRYNHVHYDNSSLGWCVDIYLSIIRLSARTTEFLPVKNGSIPLWCTNLFTSAPLFHPFSLGDWGAVVNELSHLSVERNANYGHSKAGHG